MNSKGMRKSTKEHEKRTRKGGGAVQGPVGSKVVSVMYFEEGFLVMSPGSGVTLAKLPSFFGFSFLLILLGETVTSWWSFLALNEVVYERVLKR